MTCYDQETPKITPADWNFALVLEELPIYCAENEALQRFRLRNGGGIVWYEYRCCGLTN